MTTTAIRSWLGLYVLCLVGFLGGYSFLAPDSILPLEMNDRISAFEIIIPVLVAQVSAVYRFYTDSTVGRRTALSSLPSWIVIAPPLIVSVLIFTELVLFAVAGIQRLKPPSPETFKGLLTFCVTLLNASTVLIISKYFDSKPKLMETKDATSKS